jgi:uncharacterized protein (TIGR00661 family)
MGEAVYLKKPMLAIPIEGQFEQLLNARYLEAEGFGMCAEKVPDAAAFAAFLDQVPTFAQNLNRFRHDRNRGLLTSLDQHLASRK